MPNKPQYGPDNPHPLSTMKTELVWEGKYDEYGNRRPVKLPTTPLPLQRIETIDEPLDREKATQRSMFDLEGFVQKAHRDDFRNMLIWGDNKLAMASLLEKFRGKVDLIYIDPPFFSGSDQNILIKLGENAGVIEKERSILEEVAYRNVWGLGASSFCHWMYELLNIMKDLLDSTGMIFIRFDQYWSHYVKIIADDVFGKENFQNEIVVKRIYKNVTGQGRISIPLATDSLFLYFKTDRAVLQNTKRKLANKREGFWRHMDDSSGLRNPPERVILGRTFYPPLGKHFKFGQEKADLMVAEGKIRLNPNTGRPEYWVEETDEAPLNSNWTDISGYSFTTDYPTENSEPLLQRVLEVGSKQNDLVADFFCGSGTTLAVAEKLGRRWIGVDLGRYAIHTTRKRLIQVQRELHEKGLPYRSFDVFNLGRYERQWWQMERLKGADEEHRRIVLQFYKAAALESSPSPLLHGKKAGAFVHVDKIDSIFTYDELKKAAQAAQTAGARELHCLAWEFEMELALKKQAIEAETSLIIRLKYIPREIMEPNRTECQFFEAGYLEAEAVKKSGKVDIKLVKFAPALAEAPEKEMQALRERAVKSPFDFIDFWAVDFEHRPGKPFEHHWQDFRTRKDRSLKTMTDIGWKYENSSASGISDGKKQVCVKVIDVFGVDTTTVIEVEV